MSTATGTATAQDKRLSLLRVLGPVHVWALGVGIVLVGEYMGWNFSVGKGGMIAGLVACWVAGLLYTSVAMIDSEVTSTVAAAGGQYAQAKHIVGPLMAFNVGLFLVLAYTMLEAGNAITIGFLLDTVAQMQGHTGLNQKPFIILSIMFLAWLNYRGVLVTLNFSFVITAIAFIAIIILFFAVQAGYRRSRSISARSPPSPSPMAGSACSQHCISGCGTISASRARPRPPRRCARRPAHSPMAPWPASSPW
jgi:ethanolamine permease